MPGPTLPLHLASGDLRAHEQTSADLGLLEHRKSPPLERFTEADRIAHTILLLVVIAFALGMLIGRAGYPL